MTRVVAWLRKPHFKSILSRIICLHIIVVASIGIAMPIVLFRLLEWDADKLHQIAMRQHADKLAERLTRRADGTWKLDLPPELQAVYSKAYGRYSYSVVDQAGTTLFSSLSEGGPIFPPDDRITDNEFIETRRGDVDVAGTRVLKEKYGTFLWIEVGENLAHRDVIIDDVVANFLRRVGWVTIPMLLLLFLIDLVIFRRALRPLIQASEIARNISPLRTDIRLPTEGLPFEMRPLVESMNQALVRLDQGFNAQREFIADAAHELRTPLAILRIRMDTLDDKSEIDSLRDDLDGLARVVNQLLDIAELDNDTLGPDEICDLCVVCEEVVQLLAPLAVAQHKDLALQRPDAPVMVKGNHVRLCGAVRNLAENAIRHTRRGTTVDIQVDPAGTIDVLDRGPGIPEDQQALMFRRFWRGDRRRSGGGGLGLAIVQRIVEAHNGRIAFTNRSDGGAHFTITLRPCGTQNSTLIGDGCHEGFASSRTWSDGIRMAGDQNERTIP